MTGGPPSIIRAGFFLASLGIAIIIPFVPRADSGWYFVIPLAIAGCGLGLLVSQLNNYTLAPVEEERVSEAAGVNSAAGSFGLSFGLAMAGGLMLAALSVSFTHMTENSQVIPAGPAAADRRRPRGRRRGHEQHPARRSRSPASPQRWRRRSWPSTTTPATSRCRSPCWCHSSPACSGSATPSECCGCPTRSHRRHSTGWTSADTTAGRLRSTTPRPSGHPPRHRPRTSPSHSAALAAVRLLPMREP